MATFRARELVVDNGFSKYIFGPGVQSVTLVAQTSKLRMTVTKVFAGLNEKRRGVVRPSNWNTLLFARRNVHLSSASPAERKHKQINKLEESMGVKGFLAHVRYIADSFSVFFCFQQRTNW